MILRGQNGATLELVPTGYEFAERQSEEHDDNWLNITAKASIDGAAWGGTDPCLLTWELQGLCDWLRAQALPGANAHDCLDFLEPELVFEIVSRETESIVLRITMHYAMSTGDVGEFPKDAHRSVELRVSRAALAAAAEDLARDAAAFPRR